MLLAVAAGFSILTLIVLQGAGLYTSKPGLGVPGVVIVAAMLVTAAFGRRVQVQDAQADQMLAELEQTRGAELRAAALAERQRLAREMHDVLAHSLSGLVMQLEGARLLAASDPADPRLARHHRPGPPPGRAGLEEARRAISMLRDDELPSPGRIEAMAAEFARDSGIPCQFVTWAAAGRELRDPPGPVPGRPGSADQHPQARPPREGRGDADLPAGGDLPGGGGLPARAPRPSRPRARTGGADGGYGLTGMRERAELLGGTLAAGPTSHGFRVELRVPA